VHCTANAISAVVSLLGLRPCIGDQFRDVVGKSLGFAPATMLSRGKRCRSGAKSSLKGSRSGCDRGSGDDEIAVRREHQRCAICRRAARHDRSKGCHWPRAMFSTMNGCPICSAKPIGQGRAMRLEPHRPAGCSRSALQVATDSDPQRRDLSVTWGRPSRRRATLQNHRPFQWIGLPALSVCDRQLFRCYPGLFQASCFVNSKTESEPPAAHPSRPDTEALFHLSVGAQ